MSDKEIIEAALFAAGSAVDIQRLRKITEKTTKKTISIVHALIEEYTQRECGMEIIDLGERYVMQVKPKYTDMVRPFAPKEIGAPMLRTLSMIAYHQPVLQSDLVDMRGNSTYDHVRELRERGFVEAIPHGRSKLLQTTLLFADYFGLESNDPESIKKKIIGLSREQSGQEGLNRWLGRKFVGFTPMYASLAQMCGIRDHKVINAYHPTEEELDELADVYKLVVSRGYGEDISKYYDGEIIEVGSTTFDDLVEAIGVLENVSDPDQAQQALEHIHDLKEGYVSKAMMISMKVRPATDMVARIVKDLHIGVSADGVVIAPDYGQSSEGVKIGEDADILVPTHGDPDVDLIERVRRKYDTVVEELKALDD
ncbi:MAG: SMC-Scp complex subunit ScpB [Euryarchaeota archaeon]|nr:SMC-Scp complex subunit ScpB [Euryarchaeota archaeon]